MNTCKTCRHWEVVDSVSTAKWDSVQKKSTPTPFGYCDSDRIQSGYPHGDEIILHGIGLDPDLTLSAIDNLDMVLIQDSSHYVAGMQTGPDFGCIHWAAKDTEDHT